MDPILDHIQITVKDMKRAMAFYDKLLPLLGFDPASRGTAVLEQHDMEVMEYEHPRLGFAISSPRAAFKDEDVHRRRPGSVHHVAFRAESQAEVDRIAEKLVEIGAEIVGGPKAWPQHVPAPYYAVFFKDPDGIKYEIVCAGPEAG